MNLVKTYTEENPKFALPPDYFSSIGIVHVEKKKTVDKRQLNKSLVKKRRDISF